MKTSNYIKRKLIQIIAFGYSNAHIWNFGRGKIYTGKWKQFCNPGLNCYSCPAASFACPIGALQAVNGSMDMSFSFYVTGLLLAFGVLFGRWICGWLCPFGLIQELFHSIPFPKKKLPKPLTYVKYAVLVIFVLIMPVAYTDFIGQGKPAFCQYICPSGTLLGGLPLLIKHPELRQAVSGLFSVKMLILVLTVLGCMVFYRFFCKMLCPLGAIYGLLNKISIYHLAVDTDKCISCGKCAKVCKMDVDPVNNPSSCECIRCGECAANCPGNAIKINFGNKK